MNSFNHYSIGAVGEWLYRVVLGINFDEEQPGMKHVVIAPRPGGTLTWAKGSYDSIRGTISSSWKREGSTTTYLVEIPPNVRATVDLIVSKDARLVADGKPLDDQACNTQVEVKDGRVVFDVSPGTHEIAVQ
jgi:alpha-L-rhamnosidase